MAKKLKKRINHKKMYASMATAIETGLRVKTNIVIGFPNESLRELLMTFWMCCRLAIIGVKGVTVSVYQPFLGTELTRGMYNEPSYNEYNARVFRLTGKEGPSVFNLFKMVNEPKLQLYYLLANVMMVSTFFVNCAINPLSLIASIRNVLDGKPIGAVENVASSLIRKLKIIK